MKTYIFRRLFIVLLSIALLNNTALSTSATDSNEYESESGEDVSPDGSLMYAQGGTWIQAADGRWWYRHADGTYTTSDWEYINGKWYYFDADGWMVTGWLQLGNTWYYLLPSSGEMVTGWQYIGNYWYYFNSSGAMYRGWLYETHTNKEYYLKSNGQMATGWFRVYRPSYNNGYSYWNYFDNSGMLVTDSDVQGCSHGYSSYLDNTHFNGISLNYFIDVNCSYISQINSAALYWNTASNHAVSLTRNTSGILPIDITVSDDPDIDAFGITYYYDSDGLPMSPLDGSWKKCKIGLKNNNDNPLATICHEFGHVLGLSHRISKQDSIMQIYHDYRIVSTPQQCDIDVLNHLS